MENNNENKKEFFLLKFSSKCLSITAIALSIISILLSTFTLIGARKEPRHDRRFSVNSEMKNNQFDRNYDKGFNGFHYNKRPGFESNKNQKEFIGKRDVGPSIAPEVSPDTKKNQQSNTPQNNTFNNF